MARLGARDHRGDRASLRPRRVAAPAGASVLVPVVRRRDGHGLALLRHHHQRDRRAQARARRRCEDELGLYVCGGRGRHSRKTPAGAASRSASASGFDGAALAQASRLVAKVDSAAVQDGFELYLHGFIVTDDGHWVVVQQGMNGEAAPGAPLSLAVGGADELRRGAARGDRRSGRRARSSTSPTGGRTLARGQLDLLRRSGPDGVRARSLDAGRAVARRRQLTLPHLVMPAHHDVRAGDVVLRRLHGSARRGGRPRRRRISPSCCWCRASARAPCARWPWSPRSCTARPAASPIRRASRSRTAARTAIRSRCRSRSTTRPSRC